MSATTAAVSLSPQALAERWRMAPPLAITGSALLTAVEGPWSGVGPAVPKWPNEQSRARALLALARAAWAGGRHVDAADALPTYLRNKVALTTAEREAVRLAKATHPA